MTGIIMWVFMGLIVGALAKFLMPGRDGGGFIVTALLGILGAALAGWLGGILGMYSAGEPAGFLMAVAGAVAILSVYRFTQRA